MEDSVQDVERACRDSGQRESASKGGVETSASRRTRPLEEPVDSAAFGDATIAAGDGVVAVLDDAEEYLEEYLEASKCNTTRSYRLEVGEDYSDDDDDDDEYEESACADQDDGCSVSTPVQDEVTRGDERGHRGVLEDEAVDKPKVVVGEE